MNVVFEGINGSGKTTIIKALVNQLKSDGKIVQNINEINSFSPLEVPLSEMIKKDIFLRMKKPFSTVITESLILAADFHFIQEYTKTLPGIKIFDRDIITLLVYQKYFLELEFGANNEFIKSFEKCLKFNLKNIDLMIYVEVPNEISIERTIKRDSFYFNEADKKILNDLHSLQKNYAKKFSEETKTDLIFLDGTKDINDNVKLVLNKIRQKDGEKSL